MDHIGTRKRASQFKRALTTCILVFVGVIFCTLYIAQRYRDSSIRAYSEIELQTINEISYRINAVIDTYNRHLVLIIKSPIVVETFEFQKYGLLDSYRSNLEKLRNQFNDMKLADPKIISISFSEEKCIDSLSIVNNEMLFCKSVFVGNYIKLVIDIDTLLHESSGKTTSTRLKLYSMNDSSNRFSISKEINIITSHVVNDFYLQYERDKNAVKIVGRGPIYEVITALSLLFVFLMISFIFLWRKYLSGVEQLIQGINKSSEGNFEPIPLENSYDLEIVTKHFNNMLLSMQSSQKIKIDTSIVNTARQVAHDIRSPLAALRVMSLCLGELPEEKRILIRSAVQRIDDIANNLGGKKIVNDAEKTSDDLATVQLLSSLVESLISEKRLQFRSRLGIQIESNLDKDSYGLFAKIQPVEFKRVLSNLVNNSVEAMNGKGNVTLEMQDDDFIQIVVSDNGKGIPSEILPKLMQNGATFGKETEKQSGSGLGLFHAKESLKLWGGDLKLESTVGVGTKVLITLPKHAAPTWFVSEIKLTDQTQIVILDDDSSIHHVWDSKLSEVKVKKENIFHFTTPEDVVIFCEKNDEGSAIFLFDYELLGSKKTGLDVIEELEISENSILVTSRFEEENVRERCHKLGVRLLPKNLAGFVPIILEKRDLSTPLGVGRDDSDDVGCVLIDDENMNHVMWKTLAAMKKKKLSTFYSPAEFFEQMEKFSKSTNIYIDSNLQNGLKGELVAKMIHKKGFEKIYLCTGHSPKDFPQDMPWITGIVGKMPPFGEG